MKNSIPGIYIFFLVIVLSISTNAQDILFTQFDLAPTYYNPAKTGDFYGNFRIGGIYRDRTLAITKDRMQTPSFYVDSPVIRGLGENDWVGIGGTLYQDEAGAGGLQTGEFRISAAYHLALDRKRNNYFSIGLHGGTYWRSFDTPENFTFEDEITGSVQMSPDRNNLIGENESSFAMGIGLQFTSNAGNNTTFKAGAAATHFFFYDYSLTTMREVDIPLSIVAHAELDYKINDKISIQPKILGQYLNTGLNLSVLSYMKYKLDPEKDFYLQPGIGYRLNDAAFVMAGVGWEQLKVRAAYDLTVSSFAKANGTFGALELGLMYIIRINKEPEVNEVIICPRL